jgi:hypothetical protein
MKRVQIFHLNIYDVSISIINILGAKNIKYVEDSKFFCFNYVTLFIYRQQGINAIEKKIISYFTNAF